MITHKQFDNGFKYIEIQNGQAEAKIALQGAHLFHYKVKNQASLLWLSESAYLEEGKAIRGGIPVCFPWFGKNKDDHTLPQHGFARTQIWTVILEEEIDDSTTRIQLQLKPNAYTLTQWAYLFDVILDIIIGHELSIALSVTNTDTKPFEISIALHTYFSVSDIDNVSIKGLDNRTYYDALKERTFMQKGDIFIQEEVDRVYVNPSETITLLDGDTKVTLRHEGSNSLVVWNPWIEKSKQMSDMSEDGYRTMVCLETSNAREDSRVLKANESHVLRVVFKRRVNMIEIINELKDALKSNQSLIEGLSEKSSFTWQEDYPVAVVHESVRIKEKDIVESLIDNELLNSEGFSPNRYTDEMITVLDSSAPHYIKKVSIICLKSEPQTSYIFKEKRPHDYWKKVENPGTFQAVIELSNYDESKDICQIESELRDIMRSSKEVPSVKEIGFIWVATVPRSMDLNRLLKHYFIDKYEIIQKSDQTIYIGWSDTLGEVNMRYFVCPPK